MEKIVFIKGIGEIKVVKKARLKNINISVKPFTGVVISLPYRTPFEEAETVVNRRFDWIKSALEKIELYENQYTIFDHSNLVKTHKHKLLLQPVISSEISLKVANGLISVKYPQNMNIRSMDIQKTIRTGLEKAWRKEAVEYFPLRVRELATIYGFKYKSVHIKNAKSRWGSCSYDNKINLNLHLMRLPSYLIDYVILHELAHTVEKNHGKYFWALLDKVTGKARALAKEMKTYRIGIY